MCLKLTDDIFLLSYFLTLNRTDGHTLYEVLLEEGVRGKDRQDGDDGDRHSGGFRRHIAQNRVDGGVIQVTGILLDEVDILIDRVGGAGKPGAGLALRLIGGQDEHAAVGGVEVPGLAAGNVAVELERAVLRQHADGVDAGVGAVREREVNDAVFAAEGNAGLCHVLRQGIQARALPAGQKHGNTAFFHKAARFINKETHQNNESRKMAVLLRILIIWFNFVLLFSIVFCAYNGIRYGVESSIIMMAIYGIVFYLSYKVEKKISVWLFIVATILWSNIALWLFGWFCGMQTLVLQLIMIYYFSEYGQLFKKAIFSLLIFGVYMGMYFQYAHRSMSVELSFTQYNILRIANVLLIIVSISSFGTSSSSAAPRDTAAPDAGPIKDSRRFAISSAVIGSEDSVGST